MDARCSILVLPLKLDTTEADKQLAAWQQATQSKKSVTLAAGMKGSGQGGASGGSGAAASGVAAQIKQASDNLQAIAEIQKLDAIRSWYSDLRDVADITTQSFLGFTAAEAQAASQSMYLAEKGLALTSVFGLVPGILGTVAGALIGVTHYYIEQQQEIDKLNTAIAESRDEFSQWHKELVDFGNFDASVGVKALSKEFDALQNKIKEDRGFFDWVNENKGAVAEWAEYLGVAGTEVTGLIGNVNGASISLASMAQALQSVGIGNSKLVEIFNTSEELRKKTIELQQQILSAQSQQWYAAAAKEARNLNEEAESLIANEAKIGRPKTLKQLEEDAKKAKDQLEKAADNADQLYINLSVLKENTKGKILTEQDKKDLEEAQGLFDAAKKSVQGWIASFKNAKTEENNARKQSFEDKNRENALGMIEALNKEQQEALRLAEEQAKVEQANYEKGQLYFASERAMNSERINWQKNAVASQQAFSDDIAKIQQQEARITEKHAEDLAAAYEQGFGLATDFLGGFTAQLEDNLATEQAAFKNFDLIARQGVANILKSLGRMWAARSIAEFAEGLAYLASPYGASAATASFAASAAFGAAAAAATVGGAVIAGRTSAEGSRRSDAEKEKEERSSRRGGSSSGGRISDPGPTNLRPIVINFSSSVPYTERQAQEAGRAAKGMIER